MSELTIGIDIGTTGTKIVLFDPGDGIIGQVTKESDLFSEGAGYAEADPLVWEENVFSGIRQLLAEASVDGSAVKAVAATGMVPAVILLDSQGRPLRNAILQNDARALAQIERVRSTLADFDVLAMTGSAVSQQSVGPKLLWIQDNEAEVWDKTAMVVGSYDFALMAMGAEPHVEENWAIESGLFALDRTLFEPALGAAKITPRRLPPVKRPGDVVGHVSAKAAAATGLSSSAQLVVGGADHVLSAFAAGVEREGICLVKLGGAGDILAASNSPVVDERIYLDTHPIPGLWLPNGCMATSGSLIRWMQSLLGGESLVAMDDRASRRQAAQVLCLPYFLGEKSPLHDPELRGAFFGLHLGLDKYDLYRSVLEGIAFGFRHHFEVFADSGIAVEQVLVTNGGSKSTFWKQIHANVLGVPLLPVVDHPGASLAAAEIAAIGSGLLNDWADLHNFLELGEAVLPDPEVTGSYSAAYTEWRELGVETRSLAHQISKRTKK